MLQKTTLDNGLVIVTNHNDYNKTTTISYTVRCGSYNEEDNNRGIAHFTEHMLFKGTTNRTSQQINEEIEGIGGILNAETSFEHTKYHVTVLSEYWEKGIEVLSDMIWNNLIPEDEFKKEKQVILEELKMYDDNPGAKIWDLLFKRMFLNYPNRQSVGGTIQSVSAITREQMIEFIDKFYVPSNMILVATGNIDHNKLVDFAKEFSSGVELKALKKSQIKPFKMTKLKGPDLAEKKEIAQSHLAWGLYGPKPSDDDFATSEVVACILGGNASSRLYQIIREERGLAYTVRMDSEGLSDVGLLSGYVGLDGNSINSVKEVIIAEINKIKQEPVSENELERAKAYIKGTTMIAFEKTSSQNSYIVNTLIANGKPEIDDYIKSIENVTANDIQKFTAKYLKEDNICFVQITPK